jgi:two-component system response regulator PilR (NtrC family)
MNVLERAILISENDHIELCDLPDSMKVTGAFQKSSLEGRLSIEDYTKAFICRYQPEHTEQELAAMLGITRKSLWEKRKKWGIDKKQ